MKRRFVLDENVLVLAESGTDEQGRKDLSSGRLIIEVARNCHALAFDDVLYRSYMQRGREIPRTIRLLSPLLRNAEKIVYPVRSSPLPFEEHIPADDRPFVRVAAASSAILVTTDGRLLDAIARVSGFGGFSIVALRPEDALPHALET